MTAVQPVPEHQHLVAPDLPQPAAPSVPSNPTVPAPVGYAPTQPPPAAAVAFGLAMKKRNPVAVWIGLPLITLGIYTFVWYYKIHKEMAQFDRRRSVPVAGPMLVLLLLGWTVIAPLVSYFNTGKRIAQAQRAAGLPQTCSAGVGLALMFVFGLGFLYFQSELNKVSDRYPGATPGTQIPLFA